MSALVTKATECAVAGEFGRVESMLRPHVDAARPDPAAAYLLGYSLVRLGRPAEALPYLRDAAAYRPPQHDALVEYACTLFDCEQWNEGIAEATLAVQTFPQSPRARVVLARMLQRGGLFVAAMEHTLQAMQLAPALGEPVAVFAACLAGLGHAEDAAEWFSRAVQASPADLVLRANLCHALNGAGTVPPARVLAEHRHLGALLAERSPTGRPLKNSRDPCRRLRIGLLSPDLRNHPVGRFLLPLLREADPAQVEWVAYSNTIAPDAMTGRLRGLFGGWRDVASLDDASLADLIRADQIDIAIDLAGHTGGSRVAVLAARCAPVQATFLGYPNTTGVPTIDLRLVDALTDPPGADALATERLVRLPGCMLCFEAPEGTPPVGPLPSLAGHGVTFGSFNNATKLSDQALALWAGVLRSVPGSTLAIKGRGLDEPAHTGVLERRIARAGLDPSRVRVLAYRPDTPSHLAAYHEVDLALDTHPYSGTTTTCEALWMGVPVLTMPGATHASRVSTSLLHAIGRPEWSCATPASLIARAVELTADPEHLAATRRGLRGEMAASPLCDARAYASRIVGALRSAWTEWCGQPQHAAAV